MQYKILNMEKLEETIHSLLVDDGKTEDEVFEMVNKILIKSKKRTMRTSKPEKRKNKRPVCRPVLLISDSSDDE